MLYVIFNPNASKGGAAKREASVRAALAEAGLSFELVRTDGPGAAQRLAAAAAERDHWTGVVAAGGDGTINEVVNGLLGATIPLGLIPLGTGNDLAKMFALKPNQPQVAARRLRTGQVQSVDVGVANGRAFINGLGCGLDAQVTVEALRPTRLSGFAVYLLALVRALAHYKAPVMRVCFDNQTIQQRMLLTAIGNGRCQGGGFWLTPDAVMDDGRLDLCVCTHMRLSEIVRHVPKVLRGTHTGLKQVRMARVTQVQIEAAEPVALHLDGEVISTAMRNVQIEVRPGALNMLV
jgi:YegS/Rv2252/BmrU family lipid kinase